MTHYVIKHINLDEYWRTRLGWTEYENATVFIANDRHKLPLPPFGEWVVHPGLFASQDDKGVA